jgi:hypothetical protein
MGRFRPAGAVVAASRPVLVFPPPLRPRQHLLGLWHPVPHQSQEQLAHPGGARRDPLRAPFFAGSATRDRITATAARANGLSVTCRCHPVHPRTSYSSNPQPPLADSNRSSTAHLAPATRTDSLSVVDGGPPQAKDATSSGSETLRRIRARRAYSSGSGEFVRDSARSYTRGPFAPSPQLSRCQAPAGVPASNVPTRPCRNPAQAAKSRCSASGQPFFRSTPLSRPRTYPTARRRGPLRENRGPIRSPTATHSSARRSTGCAVGRPDSARPHRKS